MALDHSSTILVENYINGKELTIPVIGDTIFPPVEIQCPSGIYDEDAKANFGAKYKALVKFSSEMDLELKDIPFIPDVFGHHHHVTEYSHAKRRGVRDIMGANNIVLKTLRLIKQLNPKIWIIENPQTGLLKNQQFMGSLKFNDASYCQYGYPYRKQTRFWNNIKEIEFKNL